MNLRRYVFLLSFLLGLSLLSSSAQQGSPNHSMGQHGCAFRPDVISRSNERHGGHDEPDAPQHLHPGDQAPCHIRHQRGAKLRPLSNADVHEEKLDADVPWKRFPGGHAAVEPKRRRQIVFYKLVHAHGATFSRAWSAHNPCNVQP